MTTNGQTELEGELAAETPQTVLYVSSNDGSDTRIYKEVRTLSREFDVIFLGVGNSEHAFIRPLCKEFHVIRGRRNWPLTVLRQVARFLHLRWIHDVHSVHVVNEQLMIFFYPFLFSTNTVLDLFDSIFLRWNLSGERVRFLKRVVYWPADRVIVTDENRRRLLPAFLHSRSEIIENFPLQYDGPFVEQRSGPLTLLFAGTLAMQRGGEFVQRLLDADDELRVIMAGWLHDNGVRRLATHDRVDYRGIIPQGDVLRISATEADYIVCIYPPTNENNINASPNKIWDAVQTGTPVIVNEEVKVSTLVRDLRCGIVVPSTQDSLGVLGQLHNQRGQMRLDYSTRTRFSWEQQEGRMLNLHHTGRCRNTCD